MTKLITRTSVNGSTLTGAQLKTALVGIIDAANSAGLQEGNRTTVTTTSTLALTQCGLVVVDCTSGSVTLTLPASGTSADDAVYDLRRIDATANTLTIQRAGADTIDGGTSVTIAASGTMRLQLPAGSSTWRVTNISGATAAAVRVALGLPATPQSMVRLHTANGYGSTNTKIKRFTTTVTNQGSDITYADSATLGATFTINANGVYAVSYADSASVADSGVAGISVNMSSGTTNIVSATASEVLSFSGDQNAANNQCVAAWTGYLPSGSVIRAHTNGVSAGGFTAHFTIVRVA